MAILEICRKIKKVTCCSNWMKWYSMTYDFPSWKIRQGRNQWKPAWGESSTIRTLRHFRSVSWIARRQEQLIPLDKYDKDSGGREERAAEHQSREGRIGKSSGLMSQLINITWSCIEGIVFPAKLISIDPLREYSVQPLCLYRCLYKQPLPNSELAYFSNMCDFREADVNTSVYSMSAPTCRCFRWPKGVLALECRTGGWVGRSAAGRNFFFWNPLWHSPKLAFGGDFQHSCI